MPHSQILQLSYTYLEVSKSVLRIVLLRNKAEYGRSVMYALETADLERSFRGHRVIDGLNLHVGKGRIVWVIGGMELVNQQLCA